MWKEASWNFLKAEIKKKKQKKEHILYDVLINSYLFVLLCLQAVTEELETEAFPLLFCPLELMFLSDKKEAS